VLAETNRPPFDLPGGSELVASFMVEYVDAYLLFMLSNTSADHVRTDDDSFPRRLAAPFDSRPELIPGFTIRSQGLLVFSQSRWWGRSCPATA
jgi:hypothetical protein